MRKHFTAVVTVVAVLAVASAGTALADQGGNPNDNACAGQFTANASSNVGLRPNEIAGLLGFENAGEWEKFVRESALICGG